VACYRVNFTVTAIQFSLGCCSPYVQTSGAPRNFFEVGGGGGVTPRIFSGGGVQQIRLRTEGRENGDLEALAP
jgi:hypothetical protein